MWPFVKAFVPGVFPASIDKASWRSLGSSKEPEGGSGLRLIASLTL